MRVEGFPFEPLNNRIFVCDYGQPAVSKGGIILPDSSKEFYRYRNSEWRFGEVLAIGPGAFNARGRRMQMPPVALFDRVAFSRKHGSRLPGDIRYEHPDYGSLLVRVLDPDKCQAIMRDFEPWWDVRASQLDPSGMMTG